jgi:hypothetical protein
MTSRVLLEAPWLDAPVPKRTPIVATGVTEPPAPVACPRSFESPHSC